MLLDIFGRLVLSSEPEQPWSFAACCLRVLPPKAAVESANWFPMTHLQQIHSQQVIRRNNGLLWDKKDEKRSISWVGFNPSDVPASSDQGPKE